MSLSITKPTVGGDNNTWGTELNTALDVIVSYCNSNTGPQGAPGLNWRGVYSGSTTYGVNDAVSYTLNGLTASYVALSGTTGTAPPDPATDSSSATWLLLASPGAGISQTNIVTSSGTVTAPAWAAFVDVIADGGGGGGGGGGAATTSGGISNQVGGGAGGQGQHAERTFSIAASTALTCTIGAGGSSGAGGAANNHAGTSGGDGSDTTVTGTGVSLTAAGGQRGLNSAGNSAAAASAGTYGGAVLGGAFNKTSDDPIPGCGGKGETFGGTPGGAGVGVPGWNGSGGGNATATLGGGSGVITGAAQFGQTGTTTGGVGTAQPANSGLGGPGGGGGAPGGAGGNGAAGATGRITLIFRSA